MTIYALGPFRLDTQDGLLLRAREPVALGRRAIALLRALVEQPGALLSTDALMEAGWSGQSVEESNLTVQIAALRRVLRTTAGGARWIETMPRRGYRFTGPVVTEAQKGVTAPPPQVEAARDPAPPTPQDDAERRQPLPIALAAAAPERRQLTIMQCAMSGPAFQSAQGDPEDMHRLLTAFHESCAAIIAEAGGAVAKLLNDGVLAYFGCPQADEHQAERAIRAARGLVQASRRADVGQTNGFQARVAIATGLVLVGDLFRDSGEKAALGEPASLAAGLVAHAVSGTVLISATTRRLVGELFRCEEREPIALPGFSEAIAVWQVVGEGVAEDRFEALHGRHIGVLVGRDEELALLLRRWDQAKEGEGCVVQISGEAGIGKSRVLAALAERIREEPHVRVRYQCSPHHINDAFFPITSQIRRAAVLPAASRRPPGSTSWRR
jgi:class 3 adenylate cyclase